EAGGGGLCRRAAGGRSACGGCETAGMTMTSPEVRPADVAAARDVLREVVAFTPLLHSRVLSDRLGGPVFLKCENLHRTGVFKPRGAYLRISRLTADEPRRRLLAPSAGQHA